MDENESIVMASPPMPSALVSLGLIVPVDGDELLPLLVVFWSSAPDARTPEYSAITRALRTEFVKVHVCVVD